MPGRDEAPPDQLRARRENVLLRLLIRIAQIEMSELSSRLQAMGYPDVQTSYIRLLGNVDTEGTRVVAIAQRLGTTRQAVSQLVAAIEAAGYLERTPDPDDRRGVLVRHTTSGRRLLADALDAMADIEGGYEAVVGAPRMRTVKRALREIAEAADPTSALGRG